MKAAKFAAFFCSVSRKIRPFRVVFESCVYKIVIQINFVLLQREAIKQFEVEKGRQSSRTRPIESRLTLTNFHAHRGNVVYLFGYK